MVRKSGDLQLNYNYEVEIDDDKILCRTIQEMRHKIGISQGTISSCLKNLDKIPIKYKNRHFKINIIRKPIYNKKVIIERQLITYN